MSKQKYITYKLEELGKIITGKTPKTTEKDNFGSDILFLTPSDDMEGKYCENTNRKLSHNGANTVKSCILPENSICVSCIGSDLGKVIKTTQTTVTNQQINSIILDENFDSDYIYYSLILLREKFKLIGTLTTAVPIINKTLFSSFEINIPPLEAQQKIVSTLSLLDKKIELNNKIIKELEVMSKELYDYWFVQFDFPDAHGKPYRTSGGAMVYNDKLKREIPVGWEVKRLGESVDCLFGYPFSTELFNEDKKGIPVVRIRDIIDNTISTYSEEIVDKKYLLNDSDVLIGMDGNFHINMWSNGDAYLNQRCARIRYSDNHCLSAFTIIYQIKPHIELREKTVSRTTVGHLSNDDIRNVHIIVPTNKLNTTDFRVMEFKVIKAKKEIRELSKLRDWLLPMLMNGQVTIGEAKEYTETKVINLSQQPNEPRVIPIDAHIVAGYIVSRLHNSSGFGRTKLQKAVHLAEFICELPLNSQAVRQIAGPFDAQMMNTIDSKFKQYNHVRVEKIKVKKGKYRYVYTPTSMVFECEDAFDKYYADKKDVLNNLLDKLKVMDLGRAEIVSTLYAVWNNRIIKNEPITDELLLNDFYAWSSHKADFSSDLVQRALDYMQKENIIPKGWGKYIDKM